MTPSPADNALAAGALVELTQGAVVTQAIAVVAQLGVADVLSDQALTVDDIAREVDAHPDALYRVLRLLSSYDVFAQRPDGRFTSTPMAEALRSDVPWSVRNLAVLMGYPAYWEEWGQLAYSVKTGEPSLPKLRGMGAYEYFEADPDYGAAFMQAMAQLSLQETAPIVAALDFSQFGTIVDVGGGGGALLAGILQHAPGSRGILFDGSAVPRGAEAVLREAGVADRCEIQGGDLFDPVPPGGDAYLLKHLIHDFPEDKALELLSNIRKAIPDEGSLLIIEFLPPEDDSRHPGNVFDLWLLILAGGKERTAAQYSDLVTQAGFRLDKVVPTEAAISIVQARPG